MSISVRDLADQPHLRVEVLAGAAGLDRSVTWAHSSDLPDPWDWLSGGELLMKNGRTLPRPAAGQARLIEGLARAGAAALVIGTDPETPAVAARATRWPTGSVCRCCGCPTRSASSCSAGRWPTP